MFSDEYKSGTTIKSSWKSNRKHRENGSQTSEILTYEVDSQTISPKDSGCQTVSLVELLQKSVSSTAAKHDELSLARFLSSVEPTISKQLKKNSAFNIFEELNWASDSESSDISITCEYCLQDTSVKNEAKKDDNSAEVTSVSWSDSGGSVAVAYGSINHMAWGQTKSYLCVWNLDRSKLNPFKCDQKLELESGIQTVSFHPSNPALIAAGLFSGVILMWDLSQDEVVYSEESHEDPVTSVCWLEPQSKKYLNLLTASTDGKLIVWQRKISRNKQPLNLARKFKIQPSSVRSSSDVRNSNSVGVTCCAVSVSVKDGIEFTTGDDRTLIAGCENGAIVKCVTDENSHDEDPVKFAYQVHLGPVYSVEWSPFHRHIFLTCSTDQRCRLYHALQASPLQEITPYSGSDRYLYSARWSPVRAMTIFSAGGSGELTAYDANGQYVINSAESEGSDGRKCRINCLQVNKKRPQFVATGNADGIAHVWQLGSKFTLTDQEATSRLKNIAEQAMNED